MNALRSYILVGCGSEIDASDDEGHTALMRAAEFGYRDIVQLLIDYGGDILAVGKGRDSVVQLLIHYGADINAMHSAHQTPLSRVLFYGHIGVAGILNFHGASNNKTSELLQISLLQASQNGRTYVAHLMIDNGST